MNPTRSGVLDALRAMGADVTETPDGMLINGGRPLHGAEVGARGDHRIAMAAAVAALVASGPTTIAGAEAAAISFPGFGRRQIPLQRGASRHRNRRKDVDLPREPFISTRTVVGLPLSEHFLLVRRPHQLLVGAQAKGHVFKLM